MHATSSLLAIPVALAGMLLLPAGRADALTAGTGTATVTVNALTSKLDITATFASATYDLGVNLGAVGTLTATSVSLCDETINSKPQKTITRKINAATTKLGKAAAATSAAKVARFQRQARTAVTAILTNATKFVSKRKGAISATCRDTIGQAFAPVLSAIDQSKF